ncbi:pyrroloquinoline quinone precursor peptide PqqA [Streptomyces halobius]|uniref:Coenzyme PQQ synthesis protein A n=1 Tax=Streptomyces halobius TaxID=2879846 RepID=A0ABY4MJ60_9ACTN|nr:pyrroloquinoline quinone precursor peptide PqqA [Streptomyces halobius]UQA97635.1 pyrroloquinoline quinone precursor peptide PqqA [Streptomyces halobius]
MQQSRQASRRPQRSRATHSPARYGEQATWRTPDYTVVETALEVTAYSLSAR